MQQNREFTSLDTTEDTSEWFRGVCKTWKGSYGFVTISQHGMNQYVGINYF
jgi:hypothetical protein